MKSIKDLCSNEKINALLADQTITEIIFNSYCKIYYERDGVLYNSLFHFESENEYLNLLENLVSLKGTTFNRERPFVELSLEDFRLSIVSDEISGTSPLLNLRRVKKLLGCNHSHEFSQLIQLVHKKANLLIVGGTSSGKTTLINSLLAEIDKNERCVVLEDTDEIVLPNAASVKLLTRPHINDQLPAVEFSELIKRSLRLRPDRILLGELRGKESFNYLMAVSTGHRGSLSSLHAESAHEALLRLEMLVQLGAPQWSLASIRKLLLFSLDAIVCLEKINGVRRIKSISFLSSLEESGLTLDTEMPPRLVDL